MFTMEQLRGLNDEELRIEFEEAFNVAKSDILQIFEELDIWEASDLPKDKFKSWSKGSSKKYVNHIVTVLRERNLISDEFYSSNADCYAFAIANQWLLSFDKQQVSSEKLKSDAAEALKKYGVPATDYVPEDEESVIDHTTYETTQQGGSEMNKEEKNKDFASGKRATKKMEAKRRKDDRRKAIELANAECEEKIRIATEEIERAKSDISKSKAAIIEAKKQRKESVKAAKKENPNAAEKFVRAIKSACTKVKNFFKKLFKKKHKENVEDDKKGSDIPYLKLTSARKKLMLNKTAVKRRRTVKLTSAQINSLKSGKAQWPNGHENYTIQTTADGAFFVLDTYKSNK